jgi:MFS family permease
MPLYFTFTFGFIGFVAVSAARVVLQLYALRLGATPTEVGFLVALYYLCPLLFSMLAGAWGDRHGARQPVLFSAICGACGLALPYFVPTLAATYVAAMLSGLSFAFFLVIVQNLVGVMSPPEKRTQNFSTFSLFAATSNFVGPLVAGFSIDQFGFAIACVTAAVLAFVPGVMVLVWGRLLPKGIRHRTTPRIRIAQTLADPAIVRILVISTLVQLGTDLFSFYIPVYGVGIGLSASAIGTLLASFAAASFVIRFALPRLVEALGEDGLLAYSFALAAVGFALVPLFHDIVPLAIVSFVFGLGTGCGQPLATMMMFGHAVEGRSGEALGLRLTVNNLMRVIAPAAFGVVVSAFGLPPVFYINAAMMGAGALVSRRRARDRTPGK